jgi:anaerobic magnesium-protoporphyrin IX monomethyl ester cyclase
MARFAFIDSLSDEKIGVMALSAILKEKGHDVDIFLAPYEDNLLEALVRFRPDAVGFGSFLTQESDLLNLFTKLKAVAPGVKTIQGGCSTIIFPDLIHHEAVDFVLRGDGEETLPKLLQVIDGGSDDGVLEQIPGLAWKNSEQVRENPGIPLIRDFASFPPIDRDLFMKYPKIRDQRTRPFILTRGCPYPCTYCGTVKLNHITRKISGSHFRYGIGQRVIDEIAYVRDRYGVKWVHFHDATFNANKRFTKEFLCLYAEQKMPPFICNIRTENVDEEMVRLLHEAGCDRVTLGVQSGSEIIRSNLTGRSKQSNANIIEAAQLFNRFKIRIHLDVIVGWPGEQVDQAMEIIPIARQTGAAKISSNVMIYLPDATITQYAYDNGYLDNFPNVFDIAVLANPFTIPLRKTPDIDKLINFDKLMTLFIKYEFLCHPWLINILLRLPPNRFYIFIKSLPNLMLNFHYECKGLRQKLSMLKLFANRAWRAKQIQKRNEESVASMRDSINVTRLSQ